MIYLRRWLQIYLILYVLTPIVCWGQATEVDPALRIALKNSIGQASSFKDRFDAEVWLVAKSPSIARYIEDPDERFRVLRLVHHEASRVGLQPNLVLAVIQIESAFDRFAVSRVGALGMMQVMPFWKKEIGREQDNLIDLETNLRYGCTILKFYLDKENGRWAEALARYNGSYGKYWYPEKVLTAWEKYWR